MFTRVAIVNRGEAAMRLIRAARELEIEDGRPLTTIALCAEEERGAMFARQADEAVSLTGTSPYLDHQGLAEVLADTGAEAVWPGWGFLSEDPAFADLVEDLGMTFIGPSGEVMRQLGDKIGAKRLAEGAGVPVAPWSGGPVPSLDAARRHASRIGYPLMVKAMAGGGGRGIRRVDEEAALAEGFDGARREAGSAFGDDTVFMERLIPGGRHVEVQVIADGEGGIWAPGVRDCSIQRRNQKVVEESASTALSAELEDRVKSAALSLAKTVGYRGAGTVEFLYRPEEDLLSFLEVNTRLQVEHPVTEFTTGIDLVKLQLHVARGGRLEGSPPPVRGHAIEVRLNAEDPAQGFAPAPGRVEHLTWAGGPGVRVETGTALGDAIPGGYDSMVAKIIGWGQHREEARARVLRALAETTVVIRGGTTNKAFLAGLLDHPDVVAGRIDTSWLDRLMASGAYRPAQQRALALIATAIDAYDAQHELARANFFAAAARGRPPTTMDFGHRVDLRLEGSVYRFDVYRIGTRRYQLTVDGQTLEAETALVAPYERTLVVAGRSMRVVSIVEHGEAVVEVDGLPHRISQGDAGLVRAPSPGVVVHVAVSPDEEVEAGRRLAVLESMKMEVALEAPVAGRVGEILVGPGTQVDAGAPVVRIEAATGRDEASTEERVGFAEAITDGEGTASPAGRLLGQLASFQELVRGFDHRAEGVGRTIAAYERDRSAVSSEEPGILRAELDVLAGFADVALLSRNRRAGQEEVPEEAHSPREYFNVFLQTRDASRSGLPPSFEAKLRAAVANYGVEDLEPTAELDEALLRIFLAQQRTTAQVPAVAAILRHHLTHPDAIPEALRQEVLDVLDRLILATQLRHPLVGALARQLRFRSFDQPLLQASRQQLDDQMLEQLSVLGTTDDPETQAACMAELVSCPRQLITLMARLDDRQHAERRKLIEVQTRRYYQVRGLDDVRHRERDGTFLVTGTFDPGGPGRGVVVAADTTIADLEDRAGTLARVAEEIDDPTVAVVDLYARWPDPPGDPEEASTRLATLLATCPLPPSVDRITVSVAAQERGHPRVGRYTFRRGESGFVEEPHLRDLHPLIAERLHLWRLDNFHLTRHPAPEDVYLFEATAREVEGDRRLIALAEVRDMTPLRDTSGAVAAVPALEHVLDSCLDGLRQALSTMPEADRPGWNRVVLFVWPPIDLPRDQWTSIVRALAPRTEGLGLEQVIVQGRVVEEDGSTREARLRLSRSAGAGLTVQLTDPPTTLLQPLDAYARRVIRARRRGSVYPYELIPFLLRPASGPPAVPTQLPSTPAALAPEAGTEQATEAPPAPASFTEYDLDDTGTLVPVDRPYGANTSAIVVATVTTPTTRYPEGMTRVAIFGDPTKALGSVAEPECRRIVAALDLAESLGAPVEWFAVCSGAKISMESGTENMDWVARVLRRLVEFTQAGGEVNVVVAGINVGAQPYWNAEATMLMHTKGILVMTPDSAMVLTGKRSLEYSGGVAAEDNFGIGGYDRIMGPNGQAQYWAPDLSGACQVLLSHYELTYVAPGERFPRRAETADPVQRDVCDAPHQVEGLDLSAVGDIFSPELNPERKRAFDMRTLMRAVVDQDRRPLERWSEMGDAGTGIVLDASLGGYAVSLIGIESRPLPRVGLLPSDGPGSWSGGTLFPLSSKKVARGINAASGRRPVVVLANLSGFDGSPESLRRLQLEYGAEIGRAVVNFDGPIVFCVVSRYHGGAFVVFSAFLNDDLEVAAVDGSYASVIGGGPAAAVVFVGEVEKRVEADERVVALNRSLDGADAEDVARLRAEAQDVRSVVRTEKQAEVGEEFDRIHTVQRAQDVGSVHRIIPAGELRPYLIEAVARGMVR